MGEAIALCTALACLLKKRSGKNRLWSRQWLRRKKCGCPIAARAARGGGGGGPRHWGIEHDWSSSSSKIFRPSSPLSARSKTHICTKQLLLQNLLLWLWYLPTGMYFGMYCWKSFSVIWQGGSSQLQTYVVDISSLFLFLEPQSRSLATTQLNANFECILPFGWSSASRCLNKKQVT